MERFDGDDVKALLDKYKDIQELIYIGHAGMEALFVDPYHTGAQTNIGSSGLQNSKYHSTVIESFPTDSMREDGVIRLYGCYTAHGDNNIARATADHFGRPVEGSTTGLSFGRWGFGGAPRPVRGGTLTTVRP